MKGTSITADLARLSWVAEKVQMYIGINEILQNPPKLVSEKA